MKWYELDKKRFVLEYMKVKNKYPDFEIYQQDEDLAWIGSVYVGDSLCLKIKILYRDSFPVFAPKVFPIDPVIPPEQWGHEWHRWQDGKICYVHPKDWAITYYTVEVIDKVKDWYANYLLYSLKVVEKMPDRGVAIEGL